MTVRFHGSMTALITPMLEDGRLDKPAFRALIQAQIDAGTEGLVPMGTTGESPTLDHAEHCEVIDLCLEETGGRVPVIAGTGSNSTREAIALTCHAAAAGAAAALVVTPYYNKPDQEGLYQHFRAVAESADIPIIVYNIPGRSVIDMSVETMARLARDVPNICGVKDATARLERPLETRIALGSAFSQLSGEDATVAAFLAQGGHGCISVTANVAPTLCARLHRAWRDNDRDTFEKTRDTLLPLHQAMFCAPSPGPVKYAASLLGLCEPHMRLPMASLSPCDQSTVRAALITTGLFPGG